MHDTHEHDRGRLRHLQARHAGLRLLLVGLASAAILTACEKEGSVKGHDGLVRQVERSKVGASSDHWIEIKSLAGEWERVGLVFGYAEDNGDYEECLKAIEGLKRVNFRREYRCAPAN